jgi:hypothetical protein
MMETSMNAPATKKSGAAAAAAAAQAAKPKPKQRRQHWFVVTAPKTTRLEKKRFGNKKEMRDFLKANIKNQNFVFYGTDGQVVSATQYDIKLSTD